MTTDQLIAAWQQWLTDNPDDTPGAVLDQLRTISAEGHRRRMLNRRAHMTTTTEGLWHDIQRRAKGDDHGPTG